ncbi:hypothetical protein GC173_08460 [bacterium]|nr:hypothetical protein [bacterium]
MKSRAPYAAAAAFLILAVIAGVQILSHSPEPPPVAAPGKPMAAKPKPPVRPTPAPADSKAPAPARTAVARTQGGPSESRLLVLGAGESTPRIWYGGAFLVDNVPVVDEWKGLNLVRDNAVYTAMLQLGIVEGADHAQIVGVTSTGTAWYGRRLTPTEWEGDVALKPRAMTGIVLTVNSSAAGPFDLRIDIPRRNAIAENDLANNLRRLAFPQLAGALSGEEPLIIQLGQATALPMLDPWTQVELRFTDRATGNVNSVPITLDPGQIVERTLDIDVREAQLVNLAVRLVTSEGGAPLAGLLIEHATQSDRYRGVTDDDGRVVIAGYDVSIAPSFLVSVGEDEVGEGPPRVTDRTSVQFTVTPDQAAAGMAEITIPVPINRWLVVPDQLWSDRVRPDDPDYPAFTLQAMGEDGENWIDIGLGQTWRGRGQTALALSDPGTYRALFAVSCLEYRCTEATTVDAENPAPEASLDGAVTPRTRTQRLTIQTQGKPLDTPTTFTITTTLPLVVPCGSFTSDAQGHLELGTISEGTLKLEGKSAAGTYSNSVTITRDTPADLVVDIDPTRP